MLYYFKNKRTIEKNLRNISYLQMPKILLVKSIRKKYFQIYIIKAN